MRLDFELDSSFDGPLEDFVPCPENALLVSEKVRRAIEGAGASNVQFIEVELRDEGGKAVATVDLPDALDDEEINSAIEQYRAS